MLYLGVMKNLSVLDSYSSLHHRINLKPPPYLEKPHDHQTTPPHRQQPAYRLLVTGLVILLPATVQTIPFPRRETP